MNAQSLGLITSTETLCAACTPSPFLNRLHKRELREEINLACEIIGPDAEPFGGCKTPID